jgi:hypothetical protein
VGGDLLIIFYYVFICRVLLPQVRAGKAVAGYWAVDVRKAGVYEIEMRRWPAETDYELSSGIDGDDVPWNRHAIDPKEAHFYSGGQAIDLRWAQLSIGGADHQCKRLS